MNCHNRKGCVEDEEFAFTNLQSIQCMCSNTTAKSTNAITNFSFHAYILNRRRADENCTAEVETSFNMAAATMEIR